MCLFVCVYVASNLFDFTCKVEVSNFAMRGSMPPNSLDFRLSTDAPSCVESAITFRFENLYLINHLKFEGVPVSQSNTEKLGELRNPFLYVVDVSADNERWMRVMDHSICKCYFSQSLFFPCVAVRCVCVCMCAMSVCVCMCAMSVCVCMLCVCACMCVFVCACICVHVCVCLINNIIWE